MRKPVVPGEDKRESPDYLRLSMAAAIVLGLKAGRFYRNASLGCMNLLMTYDKGCSANCSYCGLQKVRDGEYSDKSFIRVEWPVYRLSEIIERIKACKDKVKRVCLSQITNPHVSEDTRVILDKLRSLNIPISVLVSPTVLTCDDIKYYKENGVSMIGVAFDLATPELFNKNRGEGVNGPHNWQHYEKILSAAREVFGKNRVGVHLIVGLGETEKDMLSLIQRLHDNDVLVHMFSFYPEVSSLLKDRPQPPVEKYRRIQFGRYLIVKNLSHADRMSFNADGDVADFGINNDVRDRVIDKGTPFMTSGCPHCTRPYGDCEPGEDIRSYPFPLDETDIRKIRGQLV